MSKTSLREIIDDILLLVRNNNISESEDLSRAQIIAWVNHYRRALWKKHLDEIKEKEKQGFDIQDLIDDEFLVVKETGPHKIVHVKSGDRERDTFTRVTEDTFENIYNNDWKSILAVHDEDGEDIQYMNHMRRHYQYFRKYTFGELTSYYKDDKHIYVQGLQDQDKLKYIYVLAIYEVPDDADDAEAGDNPDEEDIKVPTWMVPDIKKLILTNELAFMLKMPSDDDNNATLDGIKPDGPREDEK